MGERGYGRRVWALLGHLSAASTEDRCAGDAVAAGDEHAQEKAGRGLFRALQS